MAKVEEALEIIKGMTGYIDSHHLFLQVEFFNFAEWFYRLDARPGHGRSAASTEKAGLGALLFHLRSGGVLDGLFNEAYIAVFSVHILSAMQLGEAIESSG